MSTSNASIKEYRAGLGLPSTAGRFRKATSDCRARGNAEINGKDVAVEERVNVDRVTTWGMKPSKDGAGKVGRAEAADIRPCRCHVRRSEKYFDL